MIIDCHGHTSAPQRLWAWRALLLASRGTDGPGAPEFTDDEIRLALMTPESGPLGHLPSLDAHGIHLQLLSPRPNHLMASERPEKIIHWFVAAAHDLIARQVALFPGRFRGVAALPQCAGAPIENALPELERCVRKLGFVGCLLNPDPYENGGSGEAPPLGDRTWYPLYEKLCELDVPAHIHATTSRSPRVGYSLHMINEESIAILGLLGSDVLADFPALRLIVSHGGGAIPYQLGRFEADSLRRGGKRFRDRLRSLYFDTVIYDRASIELLVRTVGADRCLFGEECPGIGAVIDPETGGQVDELVPVIESLDFLSTAERAMIFEGNARRVFGLTGI
jgi:predicted TIM-barrel fold metal-dependent hydrolase